MAEEVVDLTTDDDHGGHQPAMEQQQQQQQQQQQRQPNVPPAAIGVANRVFNCWIPMCPVAKPSIEFGRGRGGQCRMFINNDVKRKMNQVKDSVKMAALNCGFQIIPRHLPVQLTVWFFLKRPDSDFTSRMRGKNRLKESSLADEGTIVAVKPDTDNMAKFMLDSLTGAVFEDDAQVVELCMHKLRDCLGKCEGKMAFQVGVCRKTKSEMMPQFEAPAFDS